MEDTAKNIDEDQVDIAIANSGNVAAFERLYNRYKHWVWQLAWRLTNGDSDTAADVCQEVFVWFYTRFPGFKLTCSIKSYLYPVINHTAIRYQQKKRRFSSTELPVDIQDNSSPLANENPQGIRAELAEVLAGLTVSQREILLMKVVDDMSFAEIALALQLSESTVKTKYYRTITTLKDSPAIRDLFELLMFFLVF